jgi:hypothetical protein
MDAARKRMLFCWSLMGASVVAPYASAEDDAGIDTKTRRDLCLLSTCSSVEAVPPSTSNIATLVSDWLSKTPQFSIGFAIHFGTEQAASDREPKNVVLGSDAPELTSTNPEAAATKNSVLGRVPKVTKPMKFADHANPIQLDKILNEVVACGHRICSGNKCYDVKDEAVSNTHCDTTCEGDSNATTVDDEPIMVVPMAPPAPPNVNIASEPTFWTESAEVPSMIAQSGLDQLQVSIPVTQVIELLVAKTELSTRLEMTEQIMTERQVTHDRVQALADRNAKLATQLAVAETRQQLNDTLIASLVERTELALKLTSTDPKSLTARDPSRTFQAIQEDLSNIRRQIAILKRNQPVAFAPSYLGSQDYRPYIPTAQLPVSALTDPEVQENGLPEKKQEESGKE